MGEVKFKFDLNTGILSRDRDGVLRSGIVTRQIDRKGQPYYHLHLDGFGEALSVPEEEVYKLSVKGKQEVKFRFSMNQRILSRDRGGVLHSGIVTAQIDHNGSPHYDLQLDSQFSGITLVSVAEHEVYELVIGSAEKPDYKQHVAGALRKTQDSVPVVLEEVLLLRLAYGSVNSDDCIGEIVKFSEGEIRGAISVMKSRYNLVHWNI